MVQQIIFDTIILIDMSGSMQTPDMVVEDSLWATDRIGEMLGTGAADNFLAGLSDGYRTRRSYGAIMSSMLIATEKWTHHRGGNLAIVPFSDAAHPVHLGGKASFALEPGGEHGTAAAKAILDTALSVKPGRSMLAPALESAIEISKSSDWLRPKLFILITDGMPDDGADAERIVSERLAPRSDMTLQILGAGTSVDARPLIEMAGATGGTYLRIFGMKDLAGVFGRYARDLALKGVGPEGLKKHHGIGTVICPGCGKPMNFIEDYSSWFCYGCGKYRQDFQPVSQ